MGGTPGRMPTGGSLDAQQDVCLPPEAFQIVVGAFFCAEDVYDYLSVVHQHPTTLRLTFDRDRESAVLLLDRLANAFSHRANLAVASRGADDEEIGDDHVGA